MALQQALAKPHVYVATIPLPNHELATIVASALSVDEELRPALVDRSVVSDGSNVVLRIAATEMRILRTSVVSLLDFLVVSLSALSAFAQNPS